MFSVLPKAGLVGEPSLKGKRREIQVPNGAYAGKYMEMDTHVNVNPHDGLTHREDPKLGHLHT